MACPTQSRLRSWHQADQEGAEEAAAVVVPAVVVDVGLAATEVSAAERERGRVLSRIQYCPR